MNLSIRQTDIEFTKLPKAFSLIRPKSSIKECLTIFRRLRDEKPGKKLSRTSIKVHLAAILHFFQINNDDFNLTMKNFRIHLPSDETTAKDDDKSYTTEEIDQG